MSIVKAFRGFRPAKDKVQLVTSRPVDFYGQAELESKLRENPYSFLHVVKPDFGKKNRTVPGSPENLKLISEAFNKFISEGILVQDSTPVLYVYRQLQGSDSFTGIIACTSVDEYLDGKIRKHEQTLSRKEEKLKDYLSVCTFNAEPVSLTYPAHPEIDKEVSTLVSHEPFFDFTTTDTNRHQLWLVKDPDQISRIIGSFSEIPNLYIADGHHRTASSAILAEEMRIKHGSDMPEGFNFFMSILFPDHQLKIYDYNRLITDLGDFDNEEFLNKLEVDFIVEPIVNKERSPKKLHEFSMLLDGNWYRLNAKEHLYAGKDAASRLDATILSEAILGPILGIKDLRNDNRVSFISGTKGMDGIEKEVESQGLKAGFALFPISMDQLREVADHGLTMPPKSTWIEPKLRNAMVVYCLEEEME